MGMGLLRFFHSTAFCRDVNKSTMALLRKKTGYTFANIRKALELHNNDAVQAEKWLQEQAKTMGWSAASKLQDRKASQGLVGLAFDKKKIAMVEINCETDFVSRNEKFKSLVELVAKTCLQQPVLTSGEDTKKVYFNSEEMGKLKADNESLADHLALLIGSMGENMILKRGFCYETTRNDVSVAVAVHPPAENSPVLLGKYASFISFLIKPKELENGQEILESGGVGNQICRHIIGMNPSTIGEFNEDELVMSMESVKDDPGENDSSSDELKDELDSNEESMPTKKETELLRQEFLFDSTLTVGEVLHESGITILDFKRFQCGEAESENSSSNAEERNETGVHAALG